MKWYFEVLKKYIVFDGRARRQEYWMFMLVNFVVSVVLAILSFGTLEALYGLAVFLPSLGVSFRRLHDTDRSGLWLLLGLIPLLGALVLLYFFAQDSTPGPNPYGPNPKSDILYAEYEEVDE
ncbi:MAG: DUF805 domain-containing protein [Deltaproteobacteria bacterium]|nr:MAG: DUF805 domain-containing protein [Deltaproteobacteria bacterium]